MKLSVVTTLYYSSSYMQEFYSRILPQIRHITNDYEIVFVNDGSPDSSLEVATTLMQQDPSIIVLDLSRNFGHHKAIMTGLKESSGDLVFLIDCDLEEEPELLFPFYTKMLETNSDVVYGVQKKRKGNYFERCSGQFFYNFRNYIIQEKIPENIFIARLMKRDYVEGLLQFREKELSLDNVFYYTGYKQTPFLANKHSKGSSTYSFKKKLQLAINSITSFSSRPLLFIFNTGVFITFFSFLYVALLVFNYFLFGRSVEGWTSLIASVWLLGGIIILFVGVIGIYLSKIFTETKDRPFTIVKRKYTSSTKDEDK
jgi:putative glycosyltransferase